jgi:S1-C subfamily serine protease
MARSGYVSFCSCHRQRPTTIADGVGDGSELGFMIADPPLWTSKRSRHQAIKREAIVLTVDGRPMLSLTQFVAALYLHSPDQALTIDVLRGAQKLSFNVPGVLARDRMDQVADAADPMRSHIGPLGIFALDFSDGLRFLLPDVRLNTGVIVIGHALGFNSVDIGLRERDVIYSPNRTTIESVEQLKSAITQLKPGDPAVLQIERRGQCQYLAFEME